MQQDDTLATFARIVEMVTSVSGTKVTRDKLLREDLGIDSLLLIDVAIAAEDEFDIGIPDEELERFQTISDAVEYIRRVAPIG